MFAIHTEGTYMMGIKASEGARLYLDERLVIDNWVSHHSTLDDYTSPTKL